ncbi:hypothetical protein DYB25_006299, partial [Aphanomyces astaci]
ANEKLQQLFASFVFDMEQREYVQEAIEWTFVSYPNNDLCVTLFESRPWGLLPLLDEESRLPTGNDAHLIQSFYTAFSEHAHFTVSQLQKKILQFQIVHYAGAVTYVGDGFCDKNKDHAQAHALGFLASSCIDLYRSVFGVTSRPAPSSSKPPQATTVVHKFKSQLANLLALLHTTKPHFIRCVKPNDTMSPDVFDEPRVAEQLRCSGVLEAAKISRTGYPLRFSHAAFVHSYICLCPGVRLPPTDNLRATAHEIIQALETGAFMQPAQPPVVLATEPGRPSFQLGLTKVFMVLSVYEQLNSIRESLFGDRVLDMQRMIRGWLARVQYRRCRAAILTIQSTFRMVRIRRAFVQLRHAMVLVQKVVRGYLVRIRIWHVAAVRIQTVLRMHIARRVVNHRRVHRAMRPVVSELTSVLEYSKQFEMQNSPDTGGRRTVHMDEFSDEDESEDDGIVVGDSDYGWMGRNGRQSSSANAAVAYEVAVERSHQLGVCFERRDDDGLFVVHSVHPTLSQCVDIQSIERGDILVAINNQPPLVQSTLDLQGPHGTLHFLPPVPLLTTFRFDKARTRSSGATPPSVSSNAKAVEVLWLASMTLGVTLRMHPTLKVPQVGQISHYDNPGMINLHEGDVLIALNGLDIRRVEFSIALGLLKDAARPLVLTFESVVDTYETSKLTLLDGSFLYHVVWDAGKLGLALSQTPTGLYPKVVQVNQPGTNVMTKRQVLGDIRVSRGDKLVKVNHQSVRELAYSELLHQLRHGPKPRVVMQVGAHVWVYLEGTWLEGQVLHVTDSCIQCSVESNDMAVIVDAEPSAVYPCHRPDDANDAVVDDLASLVHLHEPAILHALALRYARNLVYTRTGSILVAVNPCHPLPHLYSSAVQATYASPSSLPLSPHVYEVAERAYRAMRAHEEPHNILVSGESGAGKTETTKILLTYLASISTPAAADTSAQDNSVIRHRVLESNPILEAFGNAKTTRNNNSSRFGKFIRLGFHPISGAMSGASISTYLLERVRLISQAKGERNFHIFYELVRGASAAHRAAFHLDDAPVHSFHYLHQSGCDTRTDGVDDVAQYQRTLHAMATVGLTHLDQTHVLQLVAAVLHLGNVKFVKKGQDGSRVADGCASAAFVCKLLGIGSHDFEASLCTREIIAGFEPVVTLVSVDRAIHARDTLAKAIYARVFEHLVCRINASMSALPSYSHQTIPPASTSSSSTHIGIVDIFGFESFDTSNSLEQLCINYANEKLQQLFGRFVFGMEQRTYEAEGVTWPFGEWPTTNEACLDLLEARPCGLFALLDEQSRLSKGSDRTLATKLYETLRSNAGHFTASKLDQAHGAFTIVHYAGAVTYSTRGFCAKNKDSVPHEALVALTASSLDFVADLFDDWHPHDPPSASSSSNTPLTNNNSGSNSRSFTGGRWSTPPPSTSFMRSSLGSRPPSSLLRSSVSLTTNNIMAATVVLTFKMQLSSLLATLNASHPHFVRCIKPNDAMTPHSFDAKRVLHQLRCCGLVSVAHIARAGFPVRVPHASYVTTYGPLVRWKKARSHKHHPDMNKQDDGAAVDAFVVAACGPSHILRGRTIVFLTHLALQTLEAAVVTCRHDAATVLQANAKAHLARSSFRNKRRATVAMQSVVRMWTARQHLRRQTDAIRMIQQGFRRLRVTWTARIERQVAWQRRHAAARAIQRRVRQHQAYVAAWRLAIMKPREDIQPIITTTPPPFTPLVLDDYPGQLSSPEDEEPETEVHSEHDVNVDGGIVPRESCLSDDSADDLLLRLVVNPPHLKRDPTYVLEWTDGVLGLSFDVSFSTPVVRRVHASLSDVAGLDAVHQGDRLIAINNHNIRPQDNLTALLLDMAPPVRLLFAPWTGPVPAFSLDMVTIGLARIVRPRTSSILQPSQFEVLVETATFAWSPYKTACAMVPMVHSFEGDMGANTGLAKLQPSDVLMQVGAVLTSDISYEEALQRVLDAPRPVVLRFQVGSRQPQAGPDQVVMAWSEGSLGVEWARDALFLRGLEIQRIHSHGLVAQQPGLRVGDVLVQINHLDTADLGPDDAMKLLMQHHPSSLQLTFHQTPAWLRHTKTVARAIVHVSSLLQDAWVVYEVWRAIAAFALFCAIYWTDEILFFPIRFL